MGYSQWTEIIYTSLNENGINLIKTKRKWAKKNYTQNSIQLNSRLI